MKKIFQNYKHELILTVFICIYTAYFTVASFLRHDNFYTGRFDLGNMDQAVWNTINGRIFQGSNDQGQIISRLSAHADFMLILLSPFYLLWSHPKMLLLIQSAVLGLGAIFIYLIAKTVLRNNGLALTFGFLFLMNPLLQFTNLYDFHAVTLAATLLIAAFYFLIKKKYLLMLVFLILSGITKEQIWVVVSFFGIPLLTSKTREVKLLGSGIIFFSLILFYYLVSIAIPQSLGREHFALTYFSDFGNTPFDVITKVLFSPQKLIAVLSEGNRFDYLKQIFMPLGFLSFISPAYLVFAVPDLLINLLSRNTNLHQIYYQYTAAITPFVFISGIFGVKTFTKWFPKVPKFYIITYLAFFTFWSAYSYGPLPGAKKPNLDMFTKPELNREVIESFLPKVPRKYSVAATNNLGAHLSQREIIYTIPAGIYKADVILFLLNDRWARPSLREQIEMAEDMKSDKAYVKMLEEEDFVVFKKKEILL